MQMKIGTGPVYHFIKSDYLTHSILLLLLSLLLLLLFCYYYYHYYYYYYHYYYHYYYYKSILFGTSICMVLHSSIT